jgi:putative thymidine phosphorylase
MKIKVKELTFKSKEIIALIGQKLADNLGIDVGGRIAVLHRGRRIVLEADIAENASNNNALFIPKEAMSYLGIKLNETADVFPMANSKSTEFIFKKLRGQHLSKAEISTIIKDIVDNVLSEGEIAYFVLGVYENGMNFDETVNLTEAIYKTGQVLNWHDRSITDKHSIGGIAGNRTTPIVVPICAAAGIIMPKTSSRAITSAAGTADVIEVISEVNFPAKELKKIVKKTGACMAWGGSLGLAPADDKLIKVERLLDVDPEAQLIASILAKKLAVGSKHVLIDIPYGKHTKVTKAEAIKLEKKFLQIGKHFGLKIKTVLTDGSQPIGNGIGPILEILDILKVLKRDNPPKDLEGKSIFLAGIILEMLGKARKGEGKNLAMEILNSGAAFKKFNEIINAQGRKKIKLKLAKYCKNITAEKGGKIRGINNFAINSLAKLLGSPIDKSAGIYLYKHKNDKIAKGEKFMSLYSESKAKLNSAIDFYNSSKPVEIKS